MSSLLREALVGLGRAVRDRVWQGLLRESSSHWSEPGELAASDQQYAIDRFAEEELVAEARRHFAGLGPLRLLSEGLDPQGVELFPGDGGHLLVVDPIDGTRGLMHDKRSAFFLAGLAPRHGTPRLRHVRHAAMVEIPTTRSELSDVLVATRGEGFSAWVELFTRGERRPLDRRPSSATDLLHGFASVSRFCAVGLEGLGRFHAEFIAALFPDNPELGQQVFEDQYISNGGQLHALITGRDRFVADLRPLFVGPAGLTSHPYDLCTSMIAEEAGVVVTDPDGAPLDSPLDLTSRVAFVAYASEALRRAIEPALRQALRTVD